ncbi:MAG: Fe-S protein radical family [Candidatus Sulfotelmatobacter sp.]|nr:Fe-S protein radical family [Candidatus Sulfotelmatobacter sp.]
MMGEQTANLMSSLPLFASPEKSPLVGIARLASEGESLREGHEVEYFTLPAKSLLNRCISGRGMPFTWTINPYRGCEFGCQYCYARYTHEFMELRDGREFEQKIYVKQHTLELLRRDLKRVKPGEGIALGTATDPYQPAERRYEVTRGILEEFARHQGFELGIVTKSNLVVRDMDLLQQVSRSNTLSIHITITTLNTDLARILEPRAPRPDLRMEAIRELSAAGINVGMSCSPVLPGVTDSPADLEALVRAAAAAGAKHIFGGPLFLKPCSAAVFLPFLEQHFPQLVENYRLRYQERSFLPSSYGKRISQLITSFRKKYGIKRTDPRGANALASKLRTEISGEQLTLF